MQRLPLINKASATVSKAEPQRTISAKSCLLFCAPPPPHSPSPVTRSLQSGAIDKQEFGQVALWSAPCHCLCMEINTHPNHVYFRWCQCSLYWYESRTLCFIIEVSRVKIYLNIGLNHKGCRKQERTSHLPLVESLKRVSFLLQW